MTTPRSIRFEEDVTRRLGAYAAQRPGLSSSSVAARFVDEGLRMEEHPGVLFREGPTGRRAVLAGGPDVWEVVRALRSARAADSDASRPELLQVVADNTGLTARQLRTAVDYWVAYPDEVDALVAHAEDVEARALATHERATSLLG